MHADGELMHRARPSALVSKLDEDMGGAGAYRPPKLAAVAMGAPAGGGGGMHADADEDLLAQAAGTATTNALELSGAAHLACSGHHSIACKQRNSQFLGLGFSMLIEQFERYANHYSRAAVAAFCLFLRGASWAAAAHASASQQYDVQPARILLVCAVSAAVSAKSLEVAVQRLMRSANHHSVSRGPRPLPTAKRDRFGPLSSCSIAL